MLSSLDNGYTIFSIYSFFVLIFSSHFHHDLFFIHNHNSDLISFSVLSLLIISLA